MSEEIAAIEGELLPPVDAEIDGPVPEPTPEELAAEIERKKAKTKQRIEKLSAESLEAKRLHAQAEADNARLRSELEQLRSKPADTKVDASGAPDPAKYPAGRYDPDYLEAMIDYKSEQRISQKLDEQRQKTTIEAQRQKIDANEAKAKETHEDYADVLTDFLGHNLAKVPQFRELVRDSDNPAELSYYLGRHPEELDKLSEMTPGQAARYIGKLEAKIDTATPTPAGKKTSDAPAPPTPIKGAQSSKVSTKDPEKMTMAEYAAWRKAGN